MSTTLNSGIDPASFSAVTGPAQDLFRYVNGPWIDMYRLPDDRSRYGSFDKLAEDAENQIREILEDDDCPAEKSHALYASFLDVDAINASGLAAIEDQLKAIDVAADKAELTRSLGAMNPAGGPDLIGIAVYGDPGAPETNIIHIEQSGLGLPDEAYYREDHYAPIREAYVDMVAKQLKNAKLAADDEQAEAQAQRFLDVETRIAANHWDNVATRDSVKTYNPTDYAELSGMLADYDLDTWIDAWQTAYDQTSAAQVQPLDFRGIFNHVVVHEPSFLTGLNAFWKAADLDDLKLWARVHVIIGSTLELPHEFDETNFEFYGKTLSGQKQQRVRWKRGVSLVNGICGEDVGREYVKRHFPESSKQRMEQLVGNLIDAYRVSISSSAWLGEETKQKALEKLSKFVPKIGYTNHWRDYSALDVRENAGFAENMRAANLYETGYQLAKVGKSVDKDEWYDGDGKLNDWWTEEDKANFEQLTQKLIDQYDAFVPTQLAEKYVDDPAQAPHVNGALTIGENIGDLSGVNIALKAYAFALDEAAGREKNGSMESIEASLSEAPEIDGFTGVQRFFLSYASIWRTKNRDELAEQYLQIDPHSPAECRTNGIARNVDLFYKAFDVKPEDGMWLDPDQRVRIW